MRTASPGFAVAGHSTVAGSRELFNNNTYRNLTVLFESRQVLTYLYDFPKRISDHRLRRKTKTS
jgi:hypothetical protein